MRRWLARVVALGISLTLSLGMLELALRTVLPIYEYAASSDSARDGQRIWRRHPGTRTVRHHPDTKQPHPVVYNALGLRQHREIDTATLGSQLSVGEGAVTVVVEETHPMPPGDGERPRRQAI